MILTLNWLPSEMLMMKSKQTIHRSKFDLTCDRMPIEGGVAKSRPTFSFRDFCRSPLGKDSLAVSFFYTSRHFESDRWPLLFFLEVVMLFEFHKRPEVRKNAVVRHFSSLKMPHNNQENRCHHHWLLHSGLKWSVELEIKKVLLSLKNVESWDDLRLELRGLSPEFQLSSSNFSWHGLEILAYHYCFTDHHCYLFHAATKIIISLGMPLGRRRISFSLVLMMIRANHLFNHCCNSSSRSF